MVGKNSGTTVVKHSQVNPHESLSTLGRFFVDGLKTQAIDQGIKQLPGELYRELSGVYENPTPGQGGDLAPGEILNLSKLKNRPDVQERRESLHVRPGLEYHSDIVRSGEHARSRELTQVEQKIQDIMTELQRLVKSSTLLSQEYAELSVEQKPASAGTYHLNFFDFMLSVIRNARQKVEDSGAWMTVAKKKNGFHQKAQSLGTKFTLSQERSAVTQTG